MKDKSRRRAMWGARYRRVLGLLLALAPLPRVALAQADSAPASARDAASDEASTLDGRGRVLLAEQRSEQAYQAYEAGDWLRAVELYLEAHGLAPSADILYNVAHIYDSRLGDRRLAMEFYRRCVAEPSATPERITRANQRLMALKEAELAAELPAPPPSSDRVRSEPAPAPEDDSGVSARSAVAWSLGALGVVGVGVGVGFGLSAMSEASRATDDCDGNLCNSRVGVDAAHAAERDARIATVGLVSGGVLIAAATALLLLGGDDPEEPVAGELRWGASASRSAVSVGVSAVW